jgi:hypothetical protein
MRTIPHPRVLVLGPLLLLAGGVSLAVAQSTSMATRPAAAPATSTAPSPDIAIVTSITKADRLEVAYSRASLPSLSDAEAKRYAQKLIDAHTAHLNKTAAIASRLRMPDIPATPAPPAAANDKEYITTILTEHQQLLADLPADGAGIQDAGLKTHVIETRRVVEMHLGEAMRIKTRLTGMSP